jgi:hypothetical protein
MGSLVGERVVFKAGKLMFSERVFRHVKCYRGWYTCMICDVVIMLLNAVVCCMRVQWFLFSGCSSLFCAVKSPNCFRASEAMSR